MCKYPHPPSPPSSHDPPCRPSRSDCPGYEIPVEKKPRRIEETGGAGDDNYYPSGDRERRPGLEPFGS